MDVLSEAAKLFENLINVEYNIILGKRGELTELILDFEKADFFHLVGLQYITDMPQLKKKRDLIFDNIINGKITNEQISKSVHYEKMRKRLNDFLSFEKILDSNEIVFKYNKKYSSFSSIDADYLMKTIVNKRTSYIFTSSDKKRKGQMCISFFFNDKCDYTRNQTSMTMLYKKKIYKDSNTFVIQYDRLSDRESNKPKSF